MRSFKDLDSNCFRAFYAAAETLNFTKAAKLVSMTQSGVSQHIRKLEEDLAVSLFLRVGKTVQLTPFGQRLKEHVERYLDDLDKLREDLHRELSEPSGLVNYAMPASCLMSPHFQMLLKERNKHFPGIDFKVTLCPSDEVAMKLLQSEIHFGFLTKKPHQPDIRVNPFCEEEYILIGRKSTDVSALSPSNLLESRFLWYPGVEVLWNYWHEHYFGGRKPVEWEGLNVVGGMNDVGGVITMVKEGLGLTVVPRHCVADAMKRKEVVEFKSSRPGLLRQIYIATLQGQAPLRRVQTIINTFLQMKHE